MNTLILTLSESCEVSIGQTQSVNKRYSICQKPTPKVHSQNAFCKTYLPSSVNFDCKGTKLFWIEQEKLLFFVVFKVGSGLIKFQSTASDVLGIVHLLCVNSAYIVRKIQEKGKTHSARFAKEANKKNRHSCIKKHEWRLRL